MTTIPSVLPFHTIVSLHGVQDDEFVLTFNLNANITASGGVLSSAGSEGAAVTLDTSAANSVKLGADQDPIIGRLMTTEARPTGNVGAVALQGVQRFPINTGVTVNVGDTLVCSGAATGMVCSRLVSTTPTADWTSNIVLEVVTTASTNYPYGYAVAYFK